MTQLLAHLFGDFIFQSDWMEHNKTKRSWPAFVHALLYSLCFVPLCWHVDLRYAAYVGSPDYDFVVEHLWGKAAHFHGWALVVIFSAHFLIDRFKLARYVVWAKNWLGVPKLWTWEEDGGIRSRMSRNVPLAVCPTGYPPTTPAWLSTWLLIIADNTLHLAINYVALKYL